MLVWSLFASGLIAFGAGCGGSQTAQGEAPTRAFRVDMGRAPSGDLLASLAVDALQRVGYRISSPTMRRIETVWAISDPTPAQQSQGWQAIRERAIVEITPRGQRYSVARMRVSYEVQEEGLPGWSAEPLPEERQDLYRALADEVKQRLERYMTQDQ